MSGTIQKQSDLDTLLDDNASGDVGAQDVKDLLWSVQGADWSEGLVSSTPYTADSDDIIIPVDATSANGVVNLPPIANGRYRRILVIKIDATANTVSVTPDGTEKINGVNGSEVLSSQWDVREFWGAPATVTSTDWIITRSI